MKKEAYIISHFDGRFGGLNTLHDYIKDRGYSTHLLLHPLDNYDLIDTILEHNGKQRIIKRKQKGVFNLIEDIIISVYNLNKSSITLFIGASNFDTLPAIICRKILRKKINKIIYYPRDYSEDRFTNKWLNKAYLVVEKIACKYSDFTISNTFRAQEKRIEIGLDPESSVVIPNPIDVEVTHNLNKKIDKTKFIYVGDVSREHGLYDVIVKIHPIIKQLTIIGNGNDLSRIKSLLNKLEVNNKIITNKTHDFVIDYLCKFNGIGLAPYNNYSKWTYYCSPLKVGEYLATGLPVLISDVPEVSQYIEKEGLGISYSTKESNLPNKIKSFVTKEFNKKAYDYHLSNTPYKLFEALNI